MKSASADPMARRMSCPQCGSAVAAGAEKWRPFCSERCKLMDLGHWFAGTYTIPAEPDADAPGAPASAGDQEPRQ